MTDFLEEFGIPLHPQADKFVGPSETATGVCVCGDPLPPLTKWTDWPNCWAYFNCPSCGTGYVDEDDFFAIYDDGVAASTTPTDPRLTPAQRAGAPAKGEPGDIRAWIDAGKPQWWHENPPAATPTDAEAET